MFSSGTPSEQAVNYTDAAAVCGKSAVNYDPDQTANKTNLTLPKSQDCASPIGPKWVASITNWFTALIDKGHQQIKAGNVCQDPLAIVSAVKDLAQQGVCEVDAAPVEDPNNYFVLIQENTPASGFKPKNTKIDHQKMTVTADGDTIAGTGALLNPLRTNLKVDGTTITGNGSTISPLRAIAGSNTINTDQLTLTGDGSVANPVKLYQVFCDQVTMVGNGSKNTPADSIKLLQVIHDATLTGYGTPASPLSVVSRIAYFPDIGSTSIFISVQSYGVGSYAPVPPGAPTGSVWVVTGGGVSGHTPDGAGGPGTTDPIYTFSIQRLS